MGVSKKKVISAVLTMAMVAPMVLGVPLTAKAAKADADEDPTNKAFVTDVYAYGNDVVVNEPIPGSTEIKVGGETYYGKSGAVNIYLGAKAGEKVKAEGVSITVNGGSVNDIILSGQGTANDGSEATDAKVTVLGGEVAGIKTQSAAKGSTVAEMKLLGGIVTTVANFGDSAGELKAADKCTVAYYGNVAKTGISGFTDPTNTNQVACKLAKLVVRPGTNGQIGTSTKAIVTDVAVEVNGEPVRVDDQMGLGFTSKDILAIPTNSDEGKEFMDYMHITSAGQLTTNVAKIRGPQSIMAGTYPYQPGMSNDPLKDDKSAWKDLIKSAKSDPNAAIKGYECVVIEATYKDAAFSRVAGSDRVQTSLEVAKEMYKLNSNTPFDNVILACANNFPDALSASTLSAVVANKTTSAAPIILVNSANEMNVALAVKDLWDPAGGGNIYLVGGEAVLSNSVVDALNKVIKEDNTKGLYDKDTNEEGRIKRLAGADRYATNVAVLEEAKALTTKTGGTYKDPDFFKPIILASGENYPDALAASAISAPIVLTRGTAVPEGTVEFIQSVNCEGAVIVGGTGVVGTAVETWAMNEFGRSAVQRVAGVDRFETAAKIADIAKKDIAILAYGFDYPDALAAGPLAQMKEASILLVTDQNKDAAVSVGNAYGVKEGYALGGPTLISGTTAAEIIKER